MGSDHEAPPQGGSSSPVTASAVDGAQLEEPPLPLRMDDHRVILDSGATFHATGDRKVLSLLQPNHSGHATAAAFRRRDGKDLPVAGIGTFMAFNNMFRLADVLYVPELGPGVTLVSVRQLAVSGLLVMFCGTLCNIVSDAENGGSIVGKGRLHDKDGFYHLEFLRVPDQLAAAKEERVDGATE